MTYQCPQKDTKFVMEDLLDIHSHYQSLGFDDLNDEMLDAIFTEYAKFTENEIAPLNEPGDDEGCHWEDGVVTTPKGFKEAYANYIENGWPSMAQPIEYDGQGLPYSAFAAINEWMAAANHAWATYPGLSQGCMETIRAHGSDEVIQRFIPNLVSGSWTGTMCLTEPHCGSDLGLLKTKAVPQEDGTYQLTGTKIFITAGEHDMSENIIHIVLARLPDAPSGTKGISLFVVPKFNVDPEGTIVDRNSVACGSIEHKMGIKASATCVMNFDGATGYLIGTANRGLNCMFTFMNSARIGTGVEGISACDLAYQKAVAYAKDRLQMRSFNPNMRTEKAADPIIVHPDVRRMLLTQRAFAEGNRALAIYCMKEVDNTLYCKDPERTHASHSRLALLTPILKAFATETAQEATYYGMQVFGGHGFIKEWGMEQIARDTRICTMYEGTTGIQAIDLITRKVAADGGEALGAFISEIVAYCETHQGNEAVSELCTQLTAACIDWQDVSKQLLLKGQKDPEELAAAAVDYLMYSGYITVGYFWLQMAVVAQKKYEDGLDQMEFCQGKVLTAKFYFARLLGRTKAHKESILSGSESLMAIPEEWF